MPTTAGDIYVRSGTQGAFTEVKYVQGGWLTVDSSSTMVNIDVSRLQQGQLVFVESQNKFYKATVVLADYVTIFDDSASFSEYQFLTSSISNFDTQVSRSAAAAGFGTGGGATIPAGTVSSSTQTIANLNGTNILSGSILTSSVTNFNTEVSRSAAASGFGASTLPSGVVSSSAQVSYVLISNVPSGIVSSSTQTIANLNGSGILSGSSSLPAGTISGSQQITDLGFINQSQTSSMSVATASYVSPTFISASAAASGFGTATLPSGVLSSSAQIAVEISGAFTEVSSGLAGRITTLEGTIGGDVTESIVTSVVTNNGSSYYIIDDIEKPKLSFAPGLTYRFNLSGIVGSHPFKFSTSLNGPTQYTTGVTSGSGFIQIEVGYNTTTPLYYYCTNHNGMGNEINVLQIEKLITNSQTSSMSVLSALTASFISSTFISASAAASGFGSGGGASIPNGTISGSQQITDLGFINQSQTSSMSVATASFAQTASFIGNLNYNFITNLPNLISSSTQIALLGAGILSSSAQIAGDISGAFTSLSSSFASRITALEGAGGGSGIFTLTGSFYSTTNNVKITGSLSVGSGSFKAFEIDSDGFIILGDMDKDLNNAPEGTIAYSGSGFYLIT